jgi:hypothetical protein
VRLAKRVGIKKAKTVSPRFASGSTVPSSNGAKFTDQRPVVFRPCRDDGDGDLEVRPRGSSKTAFFTLRRHATERHHAEPSSQSRGTIAERTMTPAEASLKGVDKPSAIKERGTNFGRFRNGRNFGIRFIEAIHSMFLYSMRTAWRASRLSCMNLT